MKAFRSYREQTHKSRFKAEYQIRGVRLSPQVFVSGLSKEGNCRETDAIASQLGMVVHICNSSTQWVGKSQKFKVTLRYSVNWELLSQ